MFTGIIEEIGVLQGVKKGRESSVLEIRAKKVLEDTKIGDSIAVNGVCLTVTGIGQGSYQADVMAETLRRSNLGTLQPGDLLNLERALQVNGRFGGHIVSGHIDGIGTIKKLLREGNATVVTIFAEKKLLHYIVEKGSIAIDGISLTVVTVTEKDFCVSLIPHTGKETILLKKKVGDTVNLECDIIGKYVEKLLKNENNENAEEKTAKEKIAKQRAVKEENMSRISLDFLQEHGF